MKILALDLSSDCGSLAVLDGEGVLEEKVLDSQRNYAARAGQWQNDYMVDFKMAYNHYFARKKA